MSKNKQRNASGKFSLYGSNCSSVSGEMETYNQYRMARKLLLDKGILNAEELAVMSDADVEETMDKHFAYVHSDGDVLVIIRKTDIPAVDSLLIWLPR